MNHEIVEEWMRRQEDLERYSRRGCRVLSQTQNKHVNGRPLPSMVKKYKTFVVLGHCFEVNQHLRIRFGGSANELKVGLSCMDKALKEIKQKGLARSKLRSIDFSVFIELLIHTLKPLYGVK